MVLELNSRPLSIVHRSRQWQDHASVPPQSLPSPPLSSPPYSSLSQRRRSSAAHPPPAVPPPTHPIPSVPMLSTSLANGENSQFGMLDEPHFVPTHRTNTSQTYTQSVASANPLAVASFPRSQASTASTHSHKPSSTNYHAPSPSSSGSNGAKTQDIVPDRLLLSPHQPNSRSESRPSSRRALTRALELAREAVQLDATNDDPHAAVIAYGRSVALLSEVMERVRRGEDSTDGRRRSGRRRSVVAQEEEVRRLKSIHDTYADRMNILSLIYSIPPIPHSPSSLYAPSTSTESTQPPSPSSMSVGSDIDEQDAHEGIGSAMLNTSHLSQDYAASPSTPSHPYATSPDSSPRKNQATLSRTVTLPTHRAPPNRVHTTIVGRPRASSTIPPAPPPPMISPPPPPAEAVPSVTAIPPLQASRYFEGRPRVDSNGHKRTGSGTKLTSVIEEGVRPEHHPFPSGDASSDEKLQTMTSLPRRPDTPHTMKRDSHPLPPLPSPLAPSHPFRTTNATVSKPIGSATATQPTSSHPRGESVSGTTGQHLINSSIAMGTIHRRRNKTSAPPSTTTPTDSSPPTEASSSAFSMPPSSPPTPTALVPTPGTGRNRASSQPGRRPSLVNGRVSPFEPQRPPLPQTVPNNTPRKASNPSKLNQNISINVNLPPQLVVQSDILSPPPASSLAPSSMLTNLPTTPTSPFPPAPPADSQRKPYYMMGLLATTINSRSGGYITRRLHVPQGVWSQGGAKLSNLPEKVRVVEVLSSALEEMEQASVEFFGAGSICSGLALGIGSVGRKEAEAWVAKLEEFSSICDSIVANFGKKLGVGEGFVLKKSGGVTSWGGKLTRQLDKLTNGKNLDSPAVYVTGLGRLFTHAQLLDDHSRALWSQPTAPVYAAFPADVKAAAEVKLKRVSEFFASVVLTFVIRDLALLLDKYAKKCEKWLAE